MKPEEHSLKLRDSVTFSKLLGEGCSVIFYSRSIDPLPDRNINIDNTSLNLISAEGDRLLHVSIRRPENAIVFNTLPKGGGWGAEERIPLYGVFEQTDATIVIRVHEDSYLVLIDGKPVKLYKKRIDKEVKGAEYGTNSRSVFSDPIQVTVATADDPVPPAARPPAQSYQQAYFPYTAADLAAESAQEPFDYVIIGSGIGGGVLATDLLDKNKRLAANSSDFGAESTDRSANFSLASQDSAPSVSSDDRSKRILVIERGGLLFNTHSLNMPRPTNRGTYGQMNDLFYNHFKEQWEMDEATAKIWKGGPVFCLGGRSTVWGLFSPRISDDTFRAHFPAQVHDDLTNRYLRQAENTMNVSYPETLPLHRELIDRLNLRTPNSQLPTTQWEWGRLASEFKNPKNFDFAEGAYATVDRLLEAAMDDTVAPGKNKFKTLLESRALRLEPQPEAGKVRSVTHVVVEDREGKPHKIQCRNAVLAAGAVESPAVLLRSAGKSSLEAAYGKEFSRRFGHVTDHYIFFVTLPFFYHDMKNKDILGGMKLQTDITFSHIDNTTALANISLDASSFLPRRNVKDSELPQFIIAYILPSELHPDNEIELNAKGEPRIQVGYARDPQLKEKKQVLVDFAVDVMNKAAAVLGVQFVKHSAPGADHVPLKTITAKDLELGELGPGGVAHEMGSIPMPDREGGRGILDSDLKMQYGWDNVHVCDLSVFPYSPAANPTLSLTALALRLSDKLIAPETTQYQPIQVFNLTPGPVWALMSLSDSKAPSFGPTTRTKIESGKSVEWKRNRKETISVYACECASDFNIQLATPGVNALITEPPKKALTCRCN